MRSTLTAIVLLAATIACSGDRAGADQSDSAFAEVQRRGQMVMGVDQYASSHQFDKLSDGGRVALESDTHDSLAIRTIREHMQDIQTRFSRGDFSPSRAVHAQDVPGTQVMAERRDAITYEVAELPRGAELRMRTSDPAVVAAIHEFMDFQRSDHRAGGADGQHRH